MAFTVRSVFVNHYGLASGLDDEDSLRDYIEDVTAEIAHLTRQWNDYCARSVATHDDSELYYNTMSHLEGLKEQAQKKRARLRR